MGSFTASLKLWRQQVAAAPVSGTAWPRIKIAARAVFGVFLLLDSLFLVLCYITFDFFDALNSPFYSWLRDGMSIAHALYFPLFVAAVLSVGGTRKSISNRMTSIMLVLQIAGGLLLFCFGHGGAAPFGWALAFGPNLRSPLGNIVTYAEALACLLPVTWLSALHLGTNIKAIRTGPVRPLPRLSSVVWAGLLTAILYGFAAALRMREADQPRQWAAPAFSLAAQLAIFGAIWLFLHWLRVFSMKTSRPRLTEFIIRYLATWMLLAVLIRKVVMSLLAFNDSLADWYSVLYSFTAVLLVASLRVNSNSAPETATVEQELPERRSWLSRTCWLAAALAVFYFFAVRFANLDWEHVLGSVTALLFWLLLFSAVKAFGPRRYSHRWLVLASSLLLIAGAGLVAAARTPRLSDSLDQYANFDQSFFAVQQTFKPVVRDQEYSHWYKLLRDHANIRNQVETPQVSLARDLRAVKGEKPNIFILVMDGLRRDYVSAYNPGVSFTPSMQAFANDSVVFQNAYSPYAGTALASASIWSGIQQLNKIFPEPVSRLNHLQQMLDVDHYDCYLSYNPIIFTLTGASQPACTNLSAGMPVLEQQEFGKILDSLKRRLAQRSNPDRPLFLYSQPSNVHLLELAWGGAHMDVKHYPGFNDRYATATAQLDVEFGEFISFLKQQGIYDNSIIVVTADHGESLGEMGRESHVSNLTPEVIRIPLIIHVPERLKSKLVWNPERVVRLRDITPTIYYLVGHPLNQQRRLVGQPLFTRTWEEQNMKPPDHYFLMSSYMPVFGILSQDQKRLFYVDATLQRSYYYDLATDPHALHNQVTVAIQQEYEPLIRKDLERIDRFYGLAEDELEH